MNVSLNEDKWSANEIYKHIEGMGPPKANDGEDFVFTYYQWCAFFFFLQVLSSPHPLSRHASSWPLVSYGFHLRAVPWTA